MFTIGTFNVTDIHTVRINPGLSEGEGNLTLEFHAETYHGSGEEVMSEYTFFFKDLHKGYGTLMAELRKGMSEYSKRQEANG